jgi:hypothetical protein
MQMHHAGWCVCTNLLERPVDRGATSMGVDLSVDGYA